MESNKKSFHGMLKNARIQADQTMEVMGVLLNLTAEEYEDLETWKYPDEDTLKRLCLMMEWNYYDTQRLIINEMISPHRPIHSLKGGGDSIIQKKETLQKKKALPASGKINTLGDRLREVRLVTGQEVEVLSMMLGIEASLYERMEGGSYPPSDDLLQKISKVYNWNYQELLTVVKTERAREFQPVRVGMPFLGSSAQVARLKELAREIEGLLPRVPDTEQKMVLSQLELIRDSMRRHQKAS